MSEFRNLLRWQKSLVLLSSLLRPLPELLLLLPIVFGAAAAVAVSDAVAAVLPRGVE